MVQSIPACEGGFIAEAIARPYPTANRRAAGKIGKETGAVYDGLDRASALMVQSAYELQYDSKFQPTVE